MKVIDGNLATGIIELMPETPASQFRLKPLAKKRLRALAIAMEKSESAVIDLAIAHLAGTLQRDQPVFMTVPDEDSDPPKAHKPARRAS